MVSRGAGRRSRKIAWPASPGNHPPVLEPVDSGIGAEGRLPLVRSERAYLEHILHCIRRIQEDSCSGKEAVFSSPTLQDAIVRNLQILCESTQRLTELSKMRHPEVDWRGISGLRNVLVHSYFEVDLEAIWIIIRRDLPVLEGAVTRLLEESPSSA